MKANVKELHAASNLTELNAKATIDKSILNNDAKKLILSSKKLYDVAEKFRRENDQEQEYISLMRFCGVVTTAMKKCTAADKDFFKKMLGPASLNVAITRSEELSGMLQKRYEEKEVKPSQIVPDKTKNSAEENQSVKPVTTPVENGDQTLSSRTNNSSNKSLKFPPEESSEINVTRLQCLLSQKSPSILIIDCRGKSDFFSARIKHHNCISIPDQELNEGLSANKVSQMLKERYPEAYIFWAKRTTYDYIVLYDWSSTFSNLSTPIKALYEAMTKWDANEVYKAKPMILQGGIKNVYHAYPLLITQPEKLQESSNGEPSFSKPSPALSSVTYPSWNMDEISTQPKPEPEAPKVFLPKTALEASLEEHNRNLSNKIPVAVDRSTKPTSRTDSPNVNGYNKEATTTTDMSSTGKILSDHTVSPSALNTMNNNQLSKPGGFDDSRKVFPSTNGKYSGSNSLTKPEDLPPAASSDNVEQIDLEKDMSNMSLVSDKQNEKKDRLQQQRPQIPASGLKPAKYLMNGANNDVNLTPNIGSGSVTTVKLKDESFESPRSGMLKRSSSNPNISQISADSFEDLGKGIKPICDRNLKPSPNKTPVIRRDFQIVSSTEKSETGLKNLGNTCYMNSIMQCLNHTVSLVEYFTSQAFRKDFKNRGNGVRIAEDFAMAINEMNKGHRTISLADLKRCFGMANKDFRNFDQQDSHEFLAFLLDHLHEELNRVEKQRFEEQKNDGVPDEVASVVAWNQYKNSNNSIIIETFCGQIKSCVKCLACGKSSTTFDTFLYLSIPIPDNHSQGRKYSLRECLDLFTTEEVIHDWGCANCKTKERAKKKIDLWRMPPTLIIHFQRFYNDKYCKKRMTAIDFPVDHLDLTPFVKERIGPKHFQLYGVSNHYGSMDSGHYTAYCRHNRTWSNFDDHIVNQVLAQNVVSAAAYILFYNYLDTP